MLLLKELHEILDRDLKKDTPAKWGVMNAHNMVEHLSLVLAASTGKFGNMQIVNPEKMEEWKTRFFSAIRAFPKSAQMPGQPAKTTPPALRFKTIEESKEQLTRSLNDFHMYYIENPDATVVHGYFGPLTYEEWHHFHIRHFEHHLMQFGLVPEPKAHVE